MADIILNNDGNWLITPAGDVATDPACCCGGDSGGGACGCPVSPQPAAVAIQGWSYDLFAPTGVMCGTSAPPPIDPSILNAIAGGFGVPSLWDEWDGSLQGDNSYSPINSFGSKYCQTYLPCYYRAVHPSPFTFFVKIANAGISPYPLYGGAYTVLRLSNEYPIHCFWELSVSYCTGFSFFPQSAIAWYGTKSGTSAKGIYTRQCADGLGNLLGSQYTNTALATITVA